MTNATDDFAGKIDSSALDSDAVQEQLKLILTNPEFTANQRRKDFLSYVVEETLAGRSERLKGYSIAVSVYERNENFNADADPVVRLEARRLRRELEHYYLTSGRRDPIKISIPKGAYVPVFEMQAPQVPERADVGPAEPQPLPPKPQKITPTAIALVSAVAALALIGSIAFLVLFDPPAKEPAATAAGPWGDVPVVAVLPFDALGESASVKQAASGLAEDIITDLTRIQSLRVISHSSTSLLAANAKDTQKLGKMAGATHVLRGSLQFKKDKFRLNASLIEVASQQQSWAERFDYSVDERFQTQTQIAQLVSRALSVMLLPDQFSQIEKGRLPNRDAKILYRQALTILHPPSDAARVEAARALLKQVIERVPDEAHGHSGLAFVEAHGIWYGHSPNTSNKHSDIERLASKALAMDPVNSRALLALSVSAMNAGDIAESVAFAQSAVDAQPSSGYANAYLGVALIFARRPSEAIASIKTAMRLDPVNARRPYLNIFAVARFHAGDYRESIEAFRECVEREGPYGPAMMAYHAAAHFALGQKQQELEVLRQLKSAVSSQNAFSVAGWLKRASRDPDYIAPILAALERAKHVE